MEQPFQPTTLHRVGKDDAAQGSPIQGTIGTHQAGPEMALDLGQDRLPRGGKGVGNEIGVDDRHPEFGEQVRDRGLAAAYPAREGDA